MPKPLQIFLEARVKPGHDEAFRKASLVVPNAVESNEPGTLDYRWVREAGSDRVMFLDLYASSQAFVDHFHGLQSGGHLDVLMGCCDIQNVHCIGSPSQEARDILDQLGAGYFQSVGGFSRLPSLGSIAARR